MNVEPKLITQVYWMSRMLGLPVLPILNVEIDPKSYGKQNKEIS